MSTNRLYYLLAVVIFIILAVGYVFIDIDIFGKKLTYDDELLQSITMFTILDETINEDARKQLSERFNVQAVYLKDTYGDISSYGAALQMGQLKKLAGDIRGAEEAWLYVWELSPNGYVINGELANLYFYNLKDYIKAEEFYLNALAPEQIVEGNYVTYLSDLYYLYRDAFSDSKKAEEVVVRALEDLPQSIEVFALAAEHYKDAGDTIRSRELFQKILALDPENPFALNGLSGLPK